MPKSANRCGRIGQKKDRDKRSASQSKKSRCKRKCSHRKHAAACLPTRFCEVVYRDLKTTDYFKPLPKQDTSTTAMCSYAIVNRGENSAVLRLEVGPNGSDYAVDMEGVVEKGVTEIVVPSKFMRYSRLSMKSKDQGQPTRLNVYFQAQLVK